MIDKGSWFSRPGGGAAVPIDRENQLPLSIMSNRVSRQVHHPGFRQSARERAERVDHPVQGFHLAVGGTVILLASPRRLY